jgi:archaellum component FlaC
MTTELETEQAELIKKDEEHKECVNTVSTLSEAIKNHGRDRENRLLALEKEIKSLKKEVASVSKDFKVIDQYPVKLQ